MHLADYLMEKTAAPHGRWERRIFDSLAGKGMLPTNIRGPADIGDMKYAYLPDGGRVNAMGMADPVPANVERARAHRGFLAKGNKILDDLPLMDRLKDIQKNIKKEFFDPYTNKDMSKAVDNITREAVVNKLKEIRDSHVVGGVDKTKPVITLRDLPNMRPSEDTVYKGVKHKTVPLRSKNRIAFVSRHPEVASTYTDNDGLVLAYPEKDLNMDGGPLVHTPHTTLDNIGRARLRNGEPMDVYPSRTYSDYAKLPYYEAVATNHNEVVPQPYRFHNDNPEYRYDQEAGMAGATLTPLKIRLGEQADKIRSFLSRRVKQQSGAVRGAIQRRLGNMGWNNASEVGGPYGGSGLLASVTKDYRNPNWHENAIKLEDKEGLDYLRQLNHPVDR